MPLPVAMACLGLLAACAPGGAPDVRSLLDRAQVDRSTQPLLLAEIPALDAAATLIPLGSRDGVVTWQTADDVALSFRDGVVVASRGLGFDLISADVTGTLAAMNGGPQAGYSRLLTFLDGEGQTLFRAFLCEMAAPRPETIEVVGAAFPTTRHDETCNSTGLRIDNSYWRDPDGTMRRSRQWLSPGAEMLITERLTRAGEQ